MSMLMLYKLGLGISIPCRHTMEDLAMAEKNSELSTTVMISNGDPLVLNEMQS